MTTTKKEFLNWLDEQDGYWLREERVESEFPDIEFDMIGVTMQIDDDGNFRVPKRDYRQYVKYGHVWD
jgi:hypothetical protein